jgi:hypothetical protein
MIDRDGDENYQPMLIPMEGGFPEPTFEGFFKDYRVHLDETDPELNIAYMGAESRSEAMISAITTGTAARARFTTPPCETSQPRACCASDGVMPQAQVLYRHYRVFSGFCQPLCSCLCLRPGRIVVEVCLAPSSRLWGFLEPWEASIVAVRL